jgi:signal transduction histidine kinase
VISNPNNEDHGINDYSVIMIFDNATQEVEFSRLRSQFAANVSHEMRTPLTSIKGYIETVADSDFKDKKMVQDYLEKSLEEVEKLNFLIKDVLDLSKIEYRRNVLFQEDNDLVTIIKDVIGSLDFLAKKNGVSISFSHSARSIPYNTDEELFRQLVRNIVENSIFYSGKDSQIKVSLEKKEDHILLEFIDNGTGIEKEDLPFIFQRFYRGKPDISLRRIGSGLGLSIVKHTVDLHGGDIKVDSIPGVRTRFSITLPIRTKKQ